jgi:AP-3 complex subunit sigma
MIKAVVIINTSGKARLARFYDDLVRDRQVESRDDVIKRLFAACARKGEHCCNFIEDVILPGGKIVYRKYATLYFVFVVDDGESELGVLDLMQVYVEVLDKCFENVCELDLIFHPDKAYALLDEIILGGMVASVNVKEIWETYEALSKAEKR